MALEEGFVAAHILQTNDVAVADLNYPYLQEEKDNGVAIVHGYRFTSITGSTDGL